MRPNHARSLQLVVDDSIPPGLAILDAPDIDSVVTENRQLAAQLLAAADLWLFVTSAARYADAVPWEFLRAAADRSAAVAVVLDRVPPRAMSEVPPHLGQMMSERGLGDSPLFAVPETAVDAEGLLPGAAVQPIRGWLAALAYDRSSRAEVVHQTLDGAIGALVVEDADARQIGGRAGRGGRPAAGGGGPLLRRGGADDPGADRRTAPCCAGRCWPAGTSSSARVSSSAPWSRRSAGCGTGWWPRSAASRPEQRNLKVAVESGLESLVLSEADAAAERAEASWQAHAAGRQLVTATSG